MSEDTAYSAEEDSPCQCQAYLRATERAALASARWLGRADEDAAEDSAATGMRATLDALPINGRVVLGSMDDSGGLTSGAIVGSGGKEVDLALDPLEGRGVV
ncbi:MAG TPA: fructose-bisphosphatase class II, partial [Gaiellaceae bacterium]|nr:fructose-bisphosphatase class II [Gaiellaceae bacterium]